MTSSYSTDIVIFGGGVAGLWLLNRLRSAGYQVTLLECGGLGGGQTINSQGIIHGGLKYVLHGSVGGAARAIADMPERWRDCIAGHGEINLSACRVLSPHYYLWSGSGLRARLKTFLGSKAVAGKAVVAEPDEVPRCLRGRGALYRLPDFVIDAQSLIEALAAPHQDRIHGISREQVSFSRTDENLELLVGLNENLVALRAQRYIFCAGEGNENLIKQAGLSLPPRCQVRPLKMVSVSGSSLPSLFLHVLGEGLSATPALTITSHLNEAGEPVWYLGGDLAENGVARSDEEQLEAAKDLITRLFPGMEDHDLQWRCLDINRAEPATARGKRPDTCVITEEEDVIVGWPTKLTLAPALSDMVLQRLRKDDVKPAKDHSLPQDGLSRTPLRARPFWS